MSGHTVIYAPSEAIWRKDYDLAWQHCRDRGWTVTFTLDDGAGPFEAEFLDPNADCREYMGRGKNRITIDYRRVVERLRMIGWRWLVDEGVAA